MAHLQNRTSQVLQKSHQANAQRKTQIDNKETQEKGEVLTACIKNSGFSAKSKVSAFNKSRCQTESEVLLNPLLFIHTKRWATCKKGHLNIDKK